MKKFINLKRDVVWVENFTRYDSFVIVNYRGKRYKCGKSIFGTKLFPMDEKTQKYLKNTLNINVDIPTFIRDAKKDDSLNAFYTQTNNSVGNTSFFIAPNGTCLKTMDWDFD